MPKEELEFFDIGRIEWKPIEGAPGSWDKILSVDEKTGSCIRLLRLDPSCESYETLVHDFWRRSIS